MRANSKIKVESKEFTELIKNNKTASFTNEYGEKFTLHDGYVTVILSGDEVDAMIPSKHKLDDKYIPLFNSHFNIWSKEELYLLGKALQELYKDYGQS